MIQYLAHTSDGFLSLALDLDDLALNLDRKSAYLLIGLSDHSSSVPCPAIRDRRTRNHIKSLKAEVI